jgi:tRNA pseudouridine38-40 synthase
LCATLPEDIVVHTVEEVSSDFHSRRDAIERRYQYFITAGRLAIERQYSWYVPYPLDIDPMKAAAELILGHHDFEAFTKTDSGVSSFVCTVSAADWRREDSFIIFQISADHYVRGMVRAMVGTMVDVGRGYRTVEDFRRILLERDRSKAGTSAPARGLFLEEVRY